MNSYSVYSGCTALKSSPINRRNLRLSNLSFWGWTVLALAIGSNSAYAALVDFEALSAFTATGATGSYYNGNSGIGTNSNGWTSGGVHFSNTYDASFGGFWTGWSYSNIADGVTAGFGNQYAAAPGGGSNGIGGVAPGQKYAIGFGDGAFLNLPAGSLLQSLQISNTTYTALSMLNGDQFSKKFGGASGNDPDFFRVTLTGYSAPSAQGNIIGSTTIALADFTSANNSADFVLRSWSTVNLSAIASASSIGLRFSSSDVGTFGINTPTYVAIDNLSFSTVPEPTSLLLLATFASLGGYQLQRRRRNSRTHPLGDYSTIIR